MFNKSALENLNLNKKKLNLNGIPKYKKQERRNAKYNQQQKKKPKIH